MYPYPSFLPSHPQVILEALIRCLPLMTNVLVLALFYYSVFGVLCLQFFMGTLGNRCAAPNFETSFTEMSSDGRAIVKVRFSCSDSRALVLARRAWCLTLVCVLYHRMFRTLWSTNPKYAATLWFMTISSGPTLQAALSPLLLSMMTAADLGATYALGARA